MINRFKINYCIVFYLLMISNFCLIETTISIDNVKNGSLSGFENEQKVLYFTNSGIWHKFLENVYKKFSEYEVQKKVSQYVENIFSIEEWGRKDKLHGLNISEDNFQLFLDKIARYNISEHTYLNNKMITKVQFEELNHVLSITLKNKFDIQCEESYKIIKGNNIVLENVLSQIQVNDTCNNSDSDYSKGLVIFALDTVFINTDIVQPELSIAIIAPKWKIVGNRTINLTGFGGDYYKVKNNFDSEKLKKNGKNGRNGRPGLPGGPAGMFFGVGQDFLNGKNLIIIANGGEGGAGEAGTNGFPGKKGNSAESPKKSVSAFTCGKNICKDIKPDGFKCTLICVDTEYLFHTSHDKECLYKIYGQSGKRGGDGGNGGSGGKGGPAGIISLLELGNYSNISKNATEGKPGINGTGGVGGIGGEYGNHLFINCFKYRYDSVWRPAVAKLRGKIAPQGRNGTLGTNSENIKFPKKMNYFFDELKIVNEYNTYLRENLKIKYIKSTLREFLNHIESNDWIRFMKESRKNDKFEMESYKLAKFYELAEKRPKLIISG